MRLSHFISLKRKVVDESVLRRLSTGEYEPNPYGTLVEWTFTAAEAAPFVHDTLIPTLAQLGNPDDVRLLFDFSS